MLAMSNKEGVVEGSVPGLAKVAGLTLEETSDAIKRLSEPDFWSRTKTNEGRRIVEIDGGWRLLNHGKYRALMSAEERREYNRKCQADYRARVSANVNDSQSLSAMSAHSDTRRQIPKADGNPSTPPAEPSKQDALMDALASIGGSDPRQTPKARWSALGRVLKDIRTASPGVTPEEIRAHEDNYNQLYPLLPCTAEALGKWWAATVNRPKPRHQNAAPTDRDHAQGF